MYLPEHQVYALLRRFGVPTPAYHLIKQFDKESLLSGLSFERAFLKVRLYEGEEREVHEVASREEALAIVEQVFATNPSPAEVLIVPAISLEKRYYLALSILKKRGVELVASVDDGLSLSEREKEHRLFREGVESRRLHPFQIRRLLSRLGITKDRERIGKSIERIVAAFFYFDATFLEIAPFGCTEDGNFVALSVHMEIDENARFRQKEIFRLARKRPEEMVLGGNIGCMANGNGLSRATCDLVRRSGKVPSSPVSVERNIESIVQGLERLDQEAGVEKIFINLFTGLFDCKTIATAIKKWVKSKKAHKPMVIRLEGTSATKACALLKKLSKDIVATTSLKEAVEEL